MLIIRNADYVPSDGFFFFLFFARWIHEKCLHAVISGLNESRDALSPFAEAGLEKEFLDAPEPTDGSGPVRLELSRVGVSDFRGACCFGGTKVLRFERYFTLTSKLQSNITKTLEEHKEARLWFDCNIDRIGE